MRLTALYPKTGTLGPFVPCTQVFTDIQVAIDAADGGETLLVAGGHFTNVHLRAGISQVVYLSKTLYFRGGYSADFSTWNPIAHPTILDAQFLGRVLYASGPISLTIEGFDITGGRATGFEGGESASVDDAGGGIYANGVTITLRDNRVHHNIGSNSKTNTTALYYAKGGGLYLANSIALLEENQLYNNAAIEMTTDTPNIGIGGGLYIFMSDVTLLNNTIYSNTANNGSGGEGGLWRGTYCQ